MKVLFQAQGLPVLPWVVISSRDWQRAPGCAHSRRVDSLGYPVFVKPCRAGSSTGITKVRSQSELVDAVEGAQRWDPKVMVRKAAC